MVLVAIFNPAFRLLLKLQRWFEELLPEDWKLSLQHVQHTELRRATVWCVSDQAHHVDVWIATLIAHCCLSLKLVLFEIVVFLDTLIASEPDDFLFTSVQVLVVEIDLYRKFTRVGSCTSILIRFYVFFGWLYLDIWVPSHFPHLISLSSHG